MSTESQTNNKRIAKNTMLLYLRSLFLMFISLYTSRVILQTLGVEDYGIYNVVGGVVVMFQMLNSTLASACQRFITFALGKGDSVLLKRVFTTSLTLHIVLALILIVLIEGVGCWLLYNEMKIPEERIGVAFWVLQLSIATMCVNVISVPYNSSIIAHERMSAFAYISIVEGVAKLFIAFILFISPIDKLLLYAILMFCVALSIRMLYTYYCHRNFDETKNVHPKIDKGLFNEMFAFAGWNLLGNGSMALRNQGIDILLNTQFGVIVNAAKGISNQVDNAVYQFIGNFQTAIIPQITKAIANNDTERAKTLVFNGSRYSFMLLTLFVVPILFCVDYILDVWLTEVPEWSALFINLTFMYLLWDTISRLQISSILATGSIRNYQIVVGCTKLLALPLCYLVLKIGGSPASGIYVNIILEIICLCERMFFNKRMLNFSSREFFWAVIVRGWFTFLVAAGVCYVFYTYINNSFLILLTSTITISVVCITLLGINLAERKKVISFIRKKINKNE